ncbi:MAG TPA: polyprenyl synthetase family protein [Rectinemataceae bacterium]|nr:polyprenyl synthetase family protein [Rectinemataceae bacterium]
MQLEAIFEPVSGELELVERELRTAMSRIAEGAGGSGQQRSPLGILPGIIKHPFAVPGKRIRPALVLLASRAVDGSFPREPLIKLAAAVEVLHAASLVHDDIIDNAEERRHQVSLNKAFGNRVAVLAGDILYTHFFSLITGLPQVDAQSRFDILDIFIGTTRAMCIGEILAQEAAARAQPLAFEDYIQISSDKTASLFAACCEAAAVVVRAGETRRRNLKDFGLTFGLTFQMVDDLLDQDHGLDPGVDLRAETLCYARRAQELAGVFPHGVFRDRFKDLVDYVTGQSIA